MICRQIYRIRRFPCTRSFGRRERIEENIWHYLLLQSLETKFPSLNIFKRCQWGRGVVPSKRPLRSSSGEKDAYLNQNCYSLKSIFLFSVNIYSTPAINSTHLPRCSCSLASVVDRAHPINNDDIVSTCDVNHVLMYQRYVSRLHI